MSYTWTNGELITAEKLNQTGGGSGTITPIIVLLVAGVDEAISVETDNTVELTPENSKFLTRGGQEIDFTKGIIVPYWVANDLQALQFNPGMSGFFYEDTYRFAFSNTSGYTVPLYHENMMYCMFYPSEQTGD